MGLDEIGTIEAALGAPGYVPNTAQRRLAEEVTKFVHGEEGLRQALQATEVCAGRAGEEEEEEEEGLRQARQATEVHKG